ncbi:MAG TPA: SH3 domain-containing protein, partial [Skermanella sp.]|nr:SH3 domain-containing protein [Skermanella sp.]
MQNLPKSLVLLCLLVWAVIAPATAMAQGGPNLGKPQTGETILNRDVDVLVSANADSRVVMSLPKGKVVAAFGTPRRMPSWTQ